MLIVMDCDKYTIGVLLVFLTCVAYAQNVSAPAEAMGFAGEGLHLYPLGWSSEGRWGALIGREGKGSESGRIHIKVIDTVTDEPLYESEQLPWPGPDNFAAFWDAHISLFSKIIDSFNLESNRQPDFRDSQFITGGMRYAFEMQPPSPTKGAYVLRITSSRGDAKKVFSSSKTSIPREARLLGVVLSPFENRAMAVIREKGAVAGEMVFYRFVGAHLTLGFTSLKKTQSSSSVPSASLLTAVFNGQEYLVRARLAAGSNPNVKDARGYTAMLIAARLGHWQMVQDLLNAGARVNAQDSSGRTALHYAAFANNADAVRALLAAGADKNRRDGAGLRAINLTIDPALQGLLGADDAE